MLALVATFVLARALLPSRRRALCLAIPELARFLKRLRPNAYRTRLDCGQASQASRGGGNIDV